MATPAAISASADDLYHQALEAYLDGNYDQSILLAAKSLQKDPSNVKSKNLLAVLTVEKEKAAKSVIWLPGVTTVAESTPVAAAPTSVAALDTTGIQEDVQGLQTQLNRFEGNQVRKNQEVTGQIQVIQNLVRNNSDNRYEEIKKSQADIANRLQKVESRPGQDLRLLYLLCGASILFSAAAIFRGSRKIRRS